MSKILQGIKKDFPIFLREINGTPLVYLDNASTSQKPHVVIEAIARYYETMNANIHRGIHTLSEESTIAYEATRNHIASFINASSSQEIVFTKNTTEAINLVAMSWGNTHVNEGDEIIVSLLEHHANLVPWQELCARKGAHLKVIPLTSDYALDFKAYKDLLSSKTKLVCVTGMSNVTGTITPVKEIVKEAAKVGVRVFVDGAQSVAHLPTDVQDVGCDFFAFSSHKMLGPMGVGVLYAKNEVLASMPAVLFGGDMVVSVGQHSATYREAPHRFEAGTPNIADVIAFNTAITYLEDIGMDAVALHDREILDYAKKKFSQYPEVTLYSPSDPSLAGGVLSISVEGIHPHDLATIFDSEGIAIRSGQHCAEPLMERLGVAATARLSFQLYTTREDIDCAELALRKALHIFFGRE